ncbi:PH domain-containing protein [Flavobacterium aquidurense]|uniref:PH domain-containing protein n=1 Tax=Flavobacterium aquidurense TaxID=362413 RepID=UPI003716ECB1
MEKFKSKTDLWFVLFLILLFGLILVRLVYDRSWIGFGFILLVSAFIVHIFLTTYYTIKDNKVLIKCGFFYNLAIEIKDIKKVSESYNIISSPALSFDRLEIVYDKLDTVLISPKDKLRFIDTINKINPQIEIKIKDQKRHN